MIKVAMSPPCTFEDDVCPEIKTLTVCLVCSSPTDGTHFGVYSCRACAAFFRRSVSMKKKYVCRKGGDRCNLHNAHGVFCRKCRFRKCMEVGMKADCVNVKPTICKEEAASSFDSDNFELPSTSSAIEITMISRICSNYKRLCEIRRTEEERRFNATVPLEHSEYEGLRLCTAAELSRIYNSHLPHIMDFLNDSFPEFKRMEENHKWPIFQSFMAILWRVENAHRTMKYARPEKYDTVNVLTETSYVDLNKVDLFISQIPSELVKRDEVIRSLHDCMGAPRLKMMGMMKEMDLSEEEYAALLGLAVWNQVNSYYPDEKAAKSIRQKIFHDLEGHYSKKKVENCALRLGQFMCLYSAILFAAARMRENVVLLELLDTFEEESIIYSFYKNCSILG